MSMLGLLVLVGIQRGELCVTPSQKLCSFALHLTPCHTNTDTKTYFYMNVTAKLSLVLIKRVWLLAKATQQFHQSHSGAAPELDWSGSLLSAQHKKSLVCVWKRVCVCGYKFFRGWNHEYIMRKIGWFARLWVRWGFSLFLSFIHSLSISPSIYPVFIL